MKRYEEQQVTRNVLIEYNCDICGTDMQTPKGFDFSEAVIKASIGAIYPDNSSQTHYTLDICKNCFMNKVKPLVEETYNVEFTEVED